MPITMENILKHVQQSTNEGVKKLRDDWLPECCAIVDMRREEVESWMPQNDEVRFDMNNLAVVSFQLSPAR